MQTEVKKWGGNRAICIANDLADEIGQEVGSEVEIRVVNGYLEIYPPGAPRYTIDELVAQITPENRHGEIDLGPPVGKEVW